MKSYAGIGSRQISEEEKNTIISLAQRLSQLDYWLYSGHADGSDMAFEAGADPDKAVLWIPWKKFNGPSKIGKIFVPDESPEAIDSIKKFHPIGWEIVNNKSKHYGVFKIMLRNYHQIMGKEPEYPRVSFVVCCAHKENGKIVGGTGQAVRIAESLNIPVFNLRDQDWKEKFEYFLTPHTSPNPPQTCS